MQAAWDMMRRDVAERWWAIALRGVAAILLGILAFVWPGLTLVVLVIMLGAYLLVDGVLGLIAGATSRSWLLLVEGVLGVIAGILTLLWPAITAVVLLVLIAVWAILTGAAELYAAVRLRRLIKNEWLLILGGLASVVFGILLLVRPGAGLLALVWLVGVYAFVFGVLMLGLALRLRGSRGMGSRLPWSA